MSRRRRKLMPPLHSSVGEGLSTYTASVPLRKCTRGGTFASFNLTGLGEDRLQFTVWFVSSFVENAVATAIVGAFLGPIFPTSIVVVASMLPTQMHAGAISWITALGQTGSAIFPFITGVQKLLTSYVSAYNPLGPQAQ